MRKFMVFDALKAFDPSVFVVVTAVASKKSNVLLLPPAVNEVSETSPAITTMNNKKSL